MKTINLIPGVETTEAAFDADKMQKAGVDAFVLSELLGKNLGHFAQLVADGCGFGIIVKDSKAEIIGLTTSQPACQSHADLQCLAAASKMLDAIEGFMGGKQLSAEQNNLQERVFKAGIYAAAAYDAHVPKSGGEGYILTRAFLLALIDPLHEDFDYLRSDPRSGEQARQARRNSAI
jgi:hypothetical protein